jgi:peptide/nickel transport system permease protein
MEMLFLKVVGRRLVLAIPLVVVLSAMVFVILRLLPADPIAMLLPPNATEADAERLRIAYGLDQPLVVQYFKWIGGLLSGDFGESIFYKQPAAGLILNALPATIELVLIGGALGAIFGVGAGVALFAMRDTPGEHVGDIVILGMMSLPDLLWAILLLILFGVVWAVLPFMGRLDPGLSVAPVTGFLFLDTLLAGNFAAFGDAALHMVLPAITIAIGFSPVVARVVRAAMLEIENEDFVTMARLRGLSPLRILLQYQLRNAAIPTVSLIGVQLAFLLGGTMLVEVIFSYPGLGNLMVEAIRNQDLIIIQTAALAYCVLILLLNAIVEACYVVLNPKLRSAAA